MIPIRRFLLLLLALALLPALPALGEAEWNYPLSPEIINDFDMYLTLTNRQELMPADYKPGDLVTVTAHRTVKCELRKAANDALNAMFEAAAQAGYTLYVKSAYRSYDTQNTMYYNRLEKNHGKDDGLVAYPGSSDHQTGLGVDILNYDWTQKDGMNKEFAKTAEAQWMEAHCQEFGFVLRYMEDKEEETGIKFEPWHFRYVGVEAAKYIMGQHLSLEEFTREWRAYLSSFEAAGGSLKLLLWERSRMNEATVLSVSDEGEEELSIDW